MLLDANVSLLIRDPIVIKIDEEGLYSGAPWKDVFPGYAMLYVYSHKQFIAREENACTLTKRGRLYLIFLCSFFFFFYLFN